jgi:membrane protease YdiL (CAAX protease family)
LNLPRNGARPTQELAFAGLVLVGYLLGLALLARLEGPVAHWLRLTLPSLWLLGASVVLLRMSSTRLLFLGGGDRRLPLVAFTALAAALLLAATSLWPQVVGPVGAQETVRWLLLVLLVPVAEEVYFRGLLLEHLTRNTGRIWAVLLVSLLFGMLHWFQGLALPMFVLSLVLCAVTLVSGSVLWAVALHAGWNALSIVVHVPRGPWRWIPAATGLLVMLLLIVLGAATKKDDAGRGTGSRGAQA